MGHPVSAVIAELLMQEVEEKALETSPIGPKWWRRYVDDSNACIKRDSVEVFHSHLSSINANIQSTVEMPTTTTGRNSIAFLDTNNTRLMRMVKSKWMYTARPHMRASI